MQLEEGEDFIEDTEAPPELKRVRDWMLDRIRDGYDDTLRLQGISSFDQHTRRLHCFNLLNSFICNQNFFLLSLSLLDAVDFILGIPEFRRTLLEVLQFLHLGNFKNIYIYIFFLVKD